jgi:dihydropteroate synthase
VLTTEVANWARTSIRELDVARRLMHHAVDRRSLPKGVDRRLVMLRDPRVREHGADELHRLHRQIRDANFRLFAEGGTLTAMNHDLFEQDADAFRLFDRLGVQDPSHAFYLGWEMMKATLALQLGKRYVQDQALHWGMLTREEVSHRERRKVENNE